MGGIHLSHLLREMNTAHLLCTHAVCELRTDRKQHALFSR